MPLQQLKRILRRLRKPAPAPAGLTVQPETEWPLAIQLETTGICNFRCTMCSTTSYPFNNTMDDAVRRSALEAVPHLQAIVLNVGGEPLLYGKLIPLIGEIRAANPTIYIAFNTNASLMTEAHCRDFVRLGVNEIIVSADGASAETYNAVRIGGDFDTMKQKVRMLTGIKGSAPLPLVAMLMVASRENAHEIPEFVRLANELGATKVMVNGVEPYTADRAAVACYSENPDPAIERAFAEGAREAARLGIEYLCPDVAVQRGPRFCTALTYCVIRADGNLYPCSPYVSDYEFFYHGEKRRHLGPWSFGNIRDRSIHDIWNSDEYRAFRAALRGHRFHGECRQCLISEGSVCNVQIYPI